jgi:hypothetical protein
VGSIPCLLYTILCVVFEARVINLCDRDIATLNKLCLVNTLIFFSSLVLLLFILFSCWFLLLQIITIDSITNVMTNHFIYSKNLLSNIHHHKNVDLTYKTHKSSKLLDRATLRHRLAYIFSSVKKRC